jgi:hypothetical protein
MIVRMKVMDLQAKRGKKMEKIDGVRIAKN